MEVTLSQSRSFFGLYKVNCSVSFTEVEHAVFVTQGLSDREVLNWWKWDGEQKQPDPVKGHHLLRPFSKTFKTLGEANHYQTQLQSGLEQFKKYLTYSSEPLKNRTYTL